MKKVFVTNFMVHLVMLLGMSSASLAVSLLDKPILIAAGEDAHSQLISIAEELGGDARFFFEQGVSALSLEFFVRKGYSGVSTELKEKAFSLFMIGATPRKVILIGVMLRARQIAADANLRDRAGASSGISEHLVEDVERAEELVVDAMRRYGDPTGNG